MAVDGGGDRTAPESQLRADLIERVAGAIDDSEMELSDAVAGNGEGGPRPGNAKIRRYKQFDGCGCVVVGGDGQVSAGGVTGEANTELDDVALNGEELHGGGPLVVRTIPANEVDSVADVADVVLVAADLRDHGVAVAIDDHAGTAAKLDFGKGGGRVGDDGVEAKGRRANGELG